MNSLACCLIFSKEEWGGGSPLSELEQLMTKALVGCKMKLNCDLERPNEAFPVRKKHNNPSNPA